MPNHENLVLNVFQRVQREKGFVDATIAARSLAGEDAKLNKKIKRDILRHPTENYLHPIAINMLRQFLVLGDHIAIWTDDYPWRVATSGISALRGNLPTKEKHRLSLSHSIDKIGLLPGLFDSIKLKGLKKAIIVDNNKDNLERTEGLIKQTSQKIKFSLVWINPNAPDIELPASFFPEVSKRSLPDISELAEVRQEHFDPLFWIMDFNHTLNDTDNYIKAVQKSVTNILSQY